MSPQPDSAYSHSDKTLYVFLHGLFCIVDHPYGLDVLVPEVPEHSYRAGSFMGETILIARPYKEPYILHAPYGGKRFDPAKLLSVSEKRPNTGPGSHELHCRITMPLPYEIHPIKPLDLSGSLKDPHGLFHSKLAAMLIILEYKFSKLSEIKLEGHPYIATTNPPGGKYASLHFFAEEDFLPPAGHPIRGFEAAVNLFPDLRGQVSLADGPPGAPPIKDEDTLPGTIYAEYFSLQPRTASLNLLGSSMRSGRFPDMDAGASAGSDAHTCTSFVSCCS